MPIAYWDLYDIRATACQGDFVSGGGPPTQGPFVAAAAFLRVWAEPPTEGLVDQRAGMHINKQKPGMGPGMGNTHR